MGVWDVWVCGCVGDGGGTGSDTPGAVDRRPLTLGSAIPKFHEMRISSMPVRHCGCSCGAAAEGAVSIVGFIASNLVLCISFLITLLLFSDVAPDFSSTKKAERHRTRSRLRLTTTS